MVLPRRPHEEGIAMSEAERLLREYVRAGDSGDYPMLRQLLHADVVTHSPGDATVHGVDGQIAAWKAAHAGLGQLIHEIRTVVGSGKTAAARARVHGIHRGRFLGVEPTGLAWTSTKRSSSRSKRPRSSRCGRSSIPAPGYVNSASWTIRR